MSDHVYDSLACTKSSCTPKYNLSCIPKNNSLIKIFTNCVRNIKLCFKTYAFILKILKLLVPFTKSVKGGSIKT